MKISELLPPHLLERTTNAAEGQRACPTTVAEVGGADGDFVLYWTQSALRVDENPALDSAKTLAKQLELPLLVYQGISSRYRYASNRHHTFILQAAKDLENAFAQQGIRYVCYLERDPTKRPLAALIDASRVVVTEDLPTAPTTAFIRSLGPQQRAKLLLVDTACVLPMLSVGRKYDRAFAFRSATESARNKRVALPWIETGEQPAYCEHPILQDIQSVNFKRDSIPELVAGCNIDHSIAPVRDTPGGSQAGYSRWEDFLGSGITSYAKARNDATQYTRVSRMSAYLHYGMVAPTRLARDAHRRGGKGAEKYLDELLIWRELSYCYCKFTPNHRSWHSLPSWARETLDAHQADRREQTYSWEELARGVTDDSLWNAAQHSLLRHGELHNNLRMTWGKALLNWCEHPRQALKLAIDLNHRYALDGRDPNSYGGILWCFGLFDRPFNPETPVFGHVRTRSTADHARRLDVAKFRANVLKRPEKRIRVAVVGAGLSGAIAARILSDHGLDVQVFEKSRGFGGRMATRRMAANEDGTLRRTNEQDTALNQLHWDHGAQYFTARSDLFRRYVTSWQRQGLVKRWDAPIAVFNSPSGADGNPRRDSAGPAPVRYVGVPGMPAVCKKLLSGIPTHLGVPIKYARPSDRGVELVGADERSLAEVDSAVIATVAPQAKQLVSQFAGFDELDRFELRPCWAALLLLDRPLELPFGGAFVNAGPISWFALNASKPGRAVAPTVVVHASADWSEKNLERTEGDVAEQLSEAFRELLTGAHECNMQFEASAFSVASCVAHRWRYAIPTSQAHAYQSMFSDCKRVALAGDWLAGSRVEGAFLSGTAAAGRILSALPATRPDRSEQLQLF